MAERRRGSCRCMPNPFDAQDRAAPPPAPPPCDADAAWAAVEGGLRELDECAARGAVPQSNGRWSRDMSVYTGLGGVAVAYLWAGLFCQRARGDEAAAAELLRKARAVAETCLAEDGRSRYISFLIGPPGYLATAAAACKLLGDEAAAAAHVERLLRMCGAAEKHPEDELLLGRAGYLWALLWTRSVCGAGAADFDTPLRRIAERLVETGRACAARHCPDWPLMWMCYDEFYVGAAHGVVGVLAVLFRCFGLLSDRGRQLTADTARRLLRERFPSGNLPIVLGARGDEHIHWCHGAPGLPALAEAAAAASQQPGGLAGDVASDLQAAAVKAGDVVWRRGVVLKGYGLCHGLAGNGYAFLTLRRLTGDGAQLQRAEAFRALLSHRPLAEAVATQPDPQRAVPGVPDSPRSLFEGSAGVVCFVLDVSYPEGSAFPGWEL